MSAAIPALCYHRVAPGEKIELDLFRGHLDALAHCGLPSLAPTDLDTAAAGFLLTFDDGFAEIWTHLLPLLTARRIKAIVFAIPSRAEEGDPRPSGTNPFAGTAGQAHTEASCNPGPHPGFLRWSELVALEASGLVTIQSHTWSHPSGWVGDEIVGFHLGSRGRAHWSLAQATGGDDRLGIPLYRRGSAIGGRLFHDDPAARDRCAEWLTERGGEAYVAERGAAVVDGELRKLLGREAGAGRWESDAQREERTTAEIHRARAALEERLGGRRDELCLPWGEYDEVTLRCARAAGIRRVYTLRRRPNPTGRIGLFVHRFEPRPRSPRWLASRLWIYRSTARAALYRFLSGRR